jgi:hypothetical protein
VIADIAEIARERKGAGKAGDWDTGGLAIGGFTAEAGRRRENKNFTAD